MAHEWQVWADLSMAASLPLRNAASAISVEKGSFDTFDALGTSDRFAKNLRSLQGAGIGKTWDKDETVLAILAPFTEVRYSKAYPVGIS